MTTWEFTFSPTRRVMRYNHSLLPILRAAMSNAGQVGSFNTAAAEEEEECCNICNNLELDAAPTEIPVPNRVKAKKREPTASNLP
mmetsp:Transcript_12287/g.18029  ORF Transcript_12287/g.18029 Transcript_12287/m.18029 type:complete len:85 (-) Transcript_12287:857-1111(-)